MKLLYRVFNKNGSPTLIIASSEDEAREIMYSTKKVRNIHNISKVLDITKEYKQYNKEFDPDKLNSGLFYKVINGNIVDFKTSL